MNLSLAVPRKLFSHRAIAWVLLILLLITLAAWFVLRSYTSRSRQTDRPSLLDRPLVGTTIDREDASAEELLELADEVLQTSVKRYPKSAVAWSAIARRDYALSNTREAMSAWQKSVQLDPLFTEGLFGLGLLAFEDNRYADAIALYEDVAKLTPGDARVPLSLADAFLHNGQEKHAALTLEQHIVTEQSSVQAWESLGKAHLQSRKYAKAVVAFQRALQFAPGSKDALFGLAQAHRALGNREEAEKFNAQFQTLAKQAQQETKQTAVAFEDAKYAARVASVACIDSARAAKEAGDFEEAERLLLMASKLEPITYNLLTELQRLVQVQGRQQDAIDIGEHIVELSPKDVDQWLNLGTLYSEVQMVDRAVAAFKRAIEIAPDDPRCQRAKRIMRQLDPG